MAEEINDSTSHWTMQDLHAAAMYLLDQPGSNEASPPPLAAQDPVMRAAAAIYEVQCSACHTMNGTGLCRTG